MLLLCAYFCILQRFIYCFVIHVAFAVFQMNETKSAHCPKGWLIFRIFKDEKKDVLALMSYKMHSNETALAMHATGAAAYGQISNTICFCVHFERQIALRKTDKNSLSSINQCRATETCSFFFFFITRRREEYWPGMKWKNTWSFDCDRNEYLKMQLSFDGFQTRLISIFFPSNRKCL